MLKEWQFNVLFVVGVGGAIVVLLAPWIGLDIGKNPTALTGVGAILTYILTQKKAITKHDEEPPEKEIEQKKEPPNSKEAEDDGSN